jgi:hypothetical protein
VAQPILQREFVDASEFSLVVCDEGMAQRNGLSGNQQIIAANWLTRLFETGAEQAIARIGGCVTRPCGLRTRSETTRPRIKA